MCVFSVNWESNLKRYLIAYHFSDLFLKKGQLWLYYGVSHRGVSI